MVQRRKLSEIIKSRRFMRRRNNDALTMSCPEARQSLEKMNPNLSKRDIKEVQKLQQKIVRCDSKGDFRKSNTLRKSIAVIEEKADDEAKKFERIASAERLFLGLDDF